MVFSTIIFMMKIMKKIIIINNKNNKSNKKMNTKSLPLLVRVQCLVNLQHLETGA